MDFIFNKVYLAYKQHLPINNRLKVNTAVSSVGVQYSTTGGESKHVKGRTLAVDGINNVIDFLELLENDKIKGIDFLELRACDESCVGGVLSHRNRFLGVETQHKNAQRLSDTHELVGDYQRYASAFVQMDKIEPRSMVKYDRDIEVAIKKMEKAHMLLKLLPGIDCGACGAPSCESLAGDIVRGEKKLESCIFMRTMYEKRGDVSSEDAIEMMESIWGKDRFNDKK